MGIASAIFGERESRNAPTTLGTPARWFLEVFGGEPTGAGVTVNDVSALSLSAVYACVRAVSEDVAKIPIEILDRSQADAVKVVTNHPLIELLNVTPDGEVSAIGARQTMLADAMLRGNGYWEIRRRAGGQPAILHPLPAAEVTPRRVYDSPNFTPGRLVYDHAGERRFTTLDADQVVHVAGLGYDGLVGYSVVRMAKESLAIAIASERFGSNFFGRGARPSGIIKHPKVLTTDAARNLRESFERLYGGLGNSGRAVVLEEGAEWIATTIPPEDAQFLQTRQFTVPEVCRWFRVPPHKIADLSRATFSNIESQSIDYVGDSLSAWMVRLEQAFALKLLTADERRRLRIAHNEAELKRGDAESRFRGYALGRQWGWYSVNDIRLAEDMNPIGPEGDIYMQPGNMLAVGQPAGAPQGAPPGDQLPAQRARLAHAFVTSMKPLLERQLQVVLRLEADRVRRAAGKNDVAAWAKGFYPDHNAHVRNAVFPVCESVANVVAALGGKIEPGQLAARIAERHCSTSTRELAGQPGDKLELLCRGWDEARATTQATEDIQFIAALVSEAVHGGSK